jgi:hypothetical protein
VVLLCRCSNLLQLSRLRQRHTSQGYIPDAGSFPLFDHHQLVSSSFESLQVAVSADAQIDTKRILFIVYHGTIDLFFAIAHHSSAWKAISTRDDPKPEASAKHFPSTGPVLMVCNSVFLVDRILLYLPLFRAIQYLTEI